MELVRVKPRRIFRACIENEDHVDFTQYISEEFQSLKDFISSSLSGGDSSRFCKLKLQEFVQECVTYGKSEFLIEELDRLLENLIRQMVLKINNEPFESDPTNDLNRIALKYLDQPNYKSIEHFYLSTKFEICWCNIRMAMGEVIKICDPLESGLFKSNSGYTLLDKAIAHFMRDRDERRNLYDDLELGLLALISTYRRGTKVNYCQLHNLVEMFTFIQMFESFEKKLLENTSKYYNTVFTEEFERSTLAECYRKFSSIIEYEKNSCNHYLNDSSTEKVLQAMKKELLFNQAEKLLDRSYLRIILENKDVELIVLLNSLYGNTQFRLLLLDKLFMTLTEICTDLITVFLTRRNYLESHKFVTSLNSYQNEVDKMLNAIMSPNEYMNRINNFWTSVLNHNDDIIEYVTLSLAKHSDELFLEYSKEERQQKLKFILELFQYLPNKSYFEVCYRNLLSIRLLYDKALDEVHYDTITLLKKECGPNYTCKLNDILDFYERSKIMMEEFKAYADSVSESGTPVKMLIRSGDSSEKLEDEEEIELSGSKLVEYLDLSITMVSMDSWIMHNLQTAEKEGEEEQFEDAEVIEKKKEEKKIKGQFVENAHYLKQLVELQNRFREFYFHKHQKRTMDYLPQLGSAELEVTFQNRNYEFVVSIIQGYCLLLFNDNEYLNLENLQEILKSDYKEQHVRKHLSLLSNLDTPLIRFHTPSINFDTCNKKDYFELNLNFHHHDPVVDFRPKKEDLFKLDMNYVTTGRSFEDMLPFIESTIVRYLKQTMEASTVTLFKMFSKNPNFTLTRDQFNKVIDSLVSREFVQFNKTNKEFLQYMA